MTNSLQILQGVHVINPRYGYNAARITVFSATLFYIIVASNPLWLIRRTNVCINIVGR
jgi:hypothetical protein